MIEQIYSLSYIIAFTGLVGWFYFQHNEKLSSLLRFVFFGAIVAYGVSLFMADAEISYKFSTMFRDLLIISGVSAGFSMLRKNPKAFLLMGVCTALIYNFYFKAVLQQTFPQTKIVEENRQDLSLDKDWELLIEMDEGHSVKELSRVLQKYALAFEPAFEMESTQTTELDNYFVINIPSGKEPLLKKIKGALKQNELVDWVEENEAITVEPMKSAQKPSKRNKDYGINDPALSELWGFDEMQVADLYAMIKSNEIKPKKKARVFILDTGIDAKHEDLAGNYKSLQGKYDTDVKGHGTHCAGIAGAISNNGIGVASFSPNNQFIELTSIKVLADFGGGTQRGIINGMLEAADNGADVISMSLGGRSNSSREKAYSDAVKYCNDKGAIVIVAAGNSNADATGFAPAAAKGVITVAAVDTFLNRASFSNKVNNIDMGIAAPGVKIYSTTPDNTYNTFNGTSMATPYVAGLVGVMKSIQPDLTTKQVYELLKKTGKDTGDTKATGKFIQPAGVLGEM